MTSIKTAWALDWLSVTFKGSVTDLDVRKSTSFGFPLKTWTTVQARFGYAQAMTHPFGHYVMANNARPEMGVHLGFTGRSLRALEDGGISAMKMLSWAVENGGKITRLDLAIDVFEQAIDIVALAKCKRVMDCPGTARKMSIVQGDDSGTTAYIGSRKSERFLRIYDKAAERGIEGAAWTRFEVELKGRAARAAAIALGNVDDAARPGIIQGIIKSLFNPDDEVFQAVMAALPVALVTEKDTDDNTLDWLCNSVVKTIAKTMMRRADIDVWALIVQGVHENILAMGGEFEPVA